MDWGIVGGFWLNMRAQSRKILEVCWVVFFKYYFISINDFWEETEVVQGCWIKNGDILLASRFRLEKERRNINKRNCRKCKMGKSCQQETPQRVMIKGTKCQGLQKVQWSEVPWSQPKSTNFPGSSQPGCRGQLALKDVWGHRCPSGMESSARRHRVPPEKSPEAVLTPCYRYHLSCKH